MSAFCLGLGGKRDEELILPINDSLSATLSSDQVRTGLSSQRTIRKSHHPNPGLQDGQGMIKRKNSARLGRHVLATLQRCPI